MRARTLTLTAILFCVAIASFGVELAVDESQQNETGTINDDYLVIRESLGFSGSTESLYFFGESLSFTGTASGNLLAAAENIDAEGRVDDDTFLAGRTVSMNGEFSSTTFAVAESVLLTENAGVSGALFAAGRDVRIDGTVDGDLYSAARELLIAGTVDGDVRARGRSIRILETGRITGDLHYDAPRELSAAERERVDGSVTFDELPSMRKESLWGFPFALAKWITRIVISLSLLLFTLLFYLFPGIRMPESRRDQKRFWKTIAWGLLPFFGYPVLIGTFFLAGILFGITVPIAIALAAAIGPLVFLLSALAMPQLGSYVARLFRMELHQREAVYPKLLLGFPFVLVLGTIPFLNGVFFLLYISLGWGIALEQLFAKDIHGGAGK